jgi:hypothetical protein
MSRRLYAFNKHEQYEKNNWTEVDTMKWEKVPHGINVFLNAVDSANRYFSSQTDEEVISRFHKLLLKECRDNIVEANAIIDAAKLIIPSYQSNGLAITSHKNGSQRHNSIISRVYRVSQNGFTNYRYIYDNSRGRAATYRLNFEIFREDVKDSFFFTKIDSSIEEKINQEKYDFDYQSCLGTLERRLKNMRKDLDRRMSKEVIIQKAQETMHELARGRGTSSLGAFSFDMNAHTYFIERETGKLVDLNTNEPFPHPTQHYEFKSVFPLKPEHKIVLDDLNNEINTMLGELHDASKDWYEVMSDISEALGMLLIVQRARDTRERGKLIHLGLTMNEEIVK